MNQIKWEPYDRLKPGDIMRILGLRSHDEPTCKASIKE
jgi:hypothetical protein